MDRVTPPNYRVPSTPQPTDDRHTETEEGGRRSCPLATDSRVSVCVLSLQARLHHPPCTSGARDQSHHFPTRPQPTTPDISCIALASQSQPGPRRETASQNELMKCRVLWCFVFDIYSYSRTAGGHCRTQTALTLGWFAITLQCDSSPKRSRGGTHGSTKR